MKLLQSLLKVNVYDILNNVNDFLKYFMSNVSKFISLVYAVLLIVGGTIAYIKVKSLISLVTGVISGILVLISLLIGKKSARAGYLYIASISLCLSFVFLLRYFSTHTFVPGGLLFLFSITTFVITGLGFFSIGKR